MKVFPKLKLVSILVAFFLFFNSLSLTLANIKDNRVISFGIVAQFFSAKNFSMDIVKKMFAQKMQNNKQNNETNEKEQDNNQNNVVLLPNIGIMSLFNIGYNNLVGTNVLYTYDCSKTILNYPLKIPCWRLIFLLLLLKLLFNVLPRSISINYNKRNIEKACIV